MNFKMTPWLGLIVAGAALGLGCGVDHGDYCAEQRDCEALNDADEEACAEVINADAEIASIYNCSEQFDAVLDCVIAESSCEGTGNDKQYTTYDFSDLPDIDDSCRNERENLGDCIDGASDRDNSFDGSGQNG